MSNERQEICLIVGTKEMKDFMEILHGVYFTLDMSSMTTLIQMDWRHTATASPFGAAFGPSLKEKGKRKKEP